MPKLSNLSNEELMKEYTHWLIKAKYTSDPDVAAIATGFAQGCKETLKDRGIILPTKP